MRRIDERLQEAERGRNRETMQVFVEDYGVAAYNNIATHEVEVHYAGETYAEPIEKFPSNELISVLALAAQSGFLKRVVWANRFGQHRQRAFRPKKTIPITWYNEVDMVDGVVYDHVRKV